MRSFVPVSVGISLLALASGGAQATVSPPLPDVAPNLELPVTSAPYTVHLVPRVTIPQETIPNNVPNARINYVTTPNDGTGRLFVNDINGVIYKFGAAGTPATPYLDLRTQNVPLAYGYDPAGPGLVSMAFHPNFNGDPAKPGYGKFYTSETIPAAPGNATIGGVANGNTVELREWSAADPTAATFSGTSRSVMTIGGYADGHSNGLIAFNPTVGPTDPDYGALYIGSGDGHYNDTDQKAQDLSVPQGKMLRINPLAGAGGAAYTIPSDNPFLSRSGALPEIWAYGLRFPQSFGWDALTGKMYINDLGQAQFEEVDLGLAGANYGWSQREGLFATGYAYGQDSSNENVYPIPAGGTVDYTLPVGGYSHRNGYALGSGFIYRGTAIPQLFGMYITADIVTAHFLIFDPNQVVAPGFLPTLQELNLTQNGVVIGPRSTYGYESFLNGPRVDARLSEDTNGELLVAFKSTGTIYDVVADVAIPGPGPTAALLLPLAALALRPRRPLSPPL